MTADYNRLIKKGVIPESDTETVATISMFHVLVMNEIRIHELTGDKLPIDILKIFDGIRKVMIQVLTTPIRQNRTDDKRTLAKRLNLLSSGTNWKK